MTHLHVLEIPEHDLAIDGPRYDKIRVLGVELKGEYLKRRGQDEQRVNGMQILIIPKQYE